MLLRTQITIQKMYSIGEKILRMILIGRVIIHLMMTIGRVMTLKIKRRGNVIILSGRVMRF